MPAFLFKPTGKWLIVLAVGLFIGPVAWGQAPRRQSTGPARRGAYPGYRGYRATSNQQLERLRPPAARPGYQPGEGVIPAFYPAPLAGETSIPATEDPLPAEAPLETGTPVPGEHPLLPAVRWARSSMEQVLKLQDYSCTMVKRERIDGELGEQEFMFVKVRHEPLSVYMYFLKPARVKGQEVIYVQGRNGGKLQAHGTGARRLLGTVSLEPTSMLAMTGNRYPITELGLKRLLERLIEVGEHDAQFGECDVKFLPGAKINGRDCTCIQVTHPVPRRDFLFHLARIYIDTELNMPIRYEAYEWPKEPGGEPLLAEEYTYLNLKFNNGFTDADFDVRNPNYDFR